MWSHIAAYRPRTTATTTMTTAMKITDKLRFKHSVVSHFWRTVINMFGTFDSSHNIVPHKKRDQNLLCKNVVGGKNQPQNRRNLLFVNARNGQNIQISVLSSIVPVVRTSTYVLCVFRDLCRGISNKFLELCNKICKTSLQWNHKEQNAVADKKWIYSNRYSYIDDTILQFNFFQLKFE